MRLLALVAATALVVGACGPRAEVPSSASPPASAAPSTSTATARPNPSPTSHLVAFPDLPFIVGTESGDLFFQLVNGQPAGRKVHVCDGALSHLEAYGRQALFLCGDALTRTLSLYDDDTGKVTAIAKTEYQLYALTGTGQVVYVTLGRYEATAPISMSRLMSYDLRTGTEIQIDERYGVAFELRPTGEGLMVWRPKNSLAFARPDTETGTWILRGTELTKLSQYRLIEGGKGRDLLETEAVDPTTGYFNGSCCTYVVSKTGTEQRLTPPGVRDEKGLALLEDGRAVTWRPESGEYEGSVVIYNGSKVERIDRGRLGTFNLLRSGEWIVAQEAAPTPGLHAYRVSDGAFADMLGGGFTAWALLGPKK